ncbi:MAG: FMN-dependent alpha-hydroxy acid dehydrogenase family protein [Verrucomicrobiaceae bacterium]|nr:FMN-dependent alpha-hydroxy acid dehydrogenase family protein [Verrucomicrobiaceae bacterium]
MSASESIRPQPLSAIPREIAAATDYERFARARLDDNAWEFLTAGAADEITLRDNRAAFDRIRLKSKVLRDVSGGHTRLDLFGHVLEHPILLAPVGYQKLFHADGEIASALGAQVMAAPFVVSTLSSTKLEDIATNSGPLWFQLYFQRHAEHTLSLVRRAESSGCQALVVTVDAPVAGVRNREHRVGFHLPDGITAVNLADLPTSAAPAIALGNVVLDGLMANAPTWKDVAWLVSVTSLPVVVKGILDPEDALLAIQHGASGIIVSNHGGRVLDTLPASIDALPAVAAAVAGKVPLLLDGGIRRGTDIFKAIALGATAVLIGRPYIYALATAGALGVAHVLRTLREEFEVAMALSGCATLAEIKRVNLFE